MRVHLDSTTKVVEVNGVPARVWEGKTDSGVAVHAYITRIAVDRYDDTEQFEAELQRHRVPTAVVKVIPLRMIL